MFYCSLTASAWLSSAHSSLFHFDWMKKLSQQPEVGSKNRLRFWARGKILIKRTILRFMCHVNYLHYHHYHHYHHVSWYKNPDILLFINIFPRAQKRNRFFDPTSGCWDNFFIQSKLKWFWKRKPTSVRGVFSFILLIYPSWFNWIGVFIEKRKITLNRSLESSNPALYIGRVWGL